MGIQERLQWFFFIKHFAFLCHGHDKMVKNRDSDIFYNFFIIFYAPISQLKTLQHTPQYATRKTNLEGKDGLITPHYLKRNCIFKIKTQQEYNKLTLHDFKHFIKYILPNIRFKLIYSYNFPSQVPYSSLGGINVIPRPSHSLTTLTRQRTSITFQHYNITMCCST